MPLRFQSCQLDYCWDHLCCKLELFRFLSLLKWNSFYVGHSWSTCGLLARPGSEPIELWEGRRYSSISSCCRCVCPWWSPTCWNGGSGKALSHRDLWCRNRHTHQYPAEHTFHPRQHADSCQSSTEELCSTAKVSSPSAAELSHTYSNQQHFESALPCTWMMDSVQWLS